MKIRTLLSIVLLLAAGCAFSAATPGVPKAALAKSLIVVEGVQMPAWVERANGARDALTLGTLLSNKDRVITGPGARALLRLADGSLIRLGENGMLPLHHLGPNKIQCKDVGTAHV